MKCYRSGGCGPYEMCSCDECPASKPEYLERKNKKITTEKQFSAFEIVKKSNLKLAREKVMNDVMSKLFQSIGGNDLYTLGQIDMIDSLIRFQEKLTKQDYITLLEHMEKQGDYSDNIKSVISEVIKKHKCGDI